MKSYDGVIESGYKCLCRGLLVASTERDDLVLSDYTLGSEKVSDGISRLEAHYEKKGEPLPEGEWIVYTSRNDIGWLHVVVGLFEEVSEFSVGDTVIVANNSKQTYRPDVSKVTIVNITRTSKTTKYHLSDDTNVVSTSKMWRVK